MKLLTTVVVCLIVSSFAACSSPAPVREEVAPPTPVPAFTEEADEPGSTIAPDPPAPAGAEEATVSAVRDEPLGTVAGISIEADDLLAEWYQVSPREVWLVVDKLVAVRLALVEAQRLGLTVPEADIEEIYETERRLLAEDVAREHPGVSVEQVVREMLGHDPARYAVSLRQAAADQLLIERVVRSWILSHDNLSLRMIVVPAGDMETIQGFLDAGEDFAELARVHSVDDSAEFGGLVPYIARQEGSSLTRIAFETPVGEMGGPLRSGDHELLFRVEVRRDALPEAWADLEGAVLARLAEHPVTDAEFLHWKLALEREYPLDLERLRSVLGAASPARRE